MSVLRGGDAKLDVVRVVERASARDRDEGRSDGERGRGGDPSPAGRELGGRNGEGEREPGERQVEQPIGSDSGHEHDGDDVYDEPERR